MSDDMPTLPDHTLAFFIGIFSSGKPCRASFVTSSRQCRDADCSHHGELTSSKNAFVNACIRNLKGRKSGDSSKRCIFLAMSV